MITVGLTGGIGSGKSTVALYRVRAIVEQALTEGRPLPTILVTTYTNALINFSQSLLVQLLGDILDLPDGKLPPEITVSTVDSRIMHIARRSGRKFDLADETARREALHYARNAVKPQTIGDLDQLLLTQQNSMLRKQNSKQLRLKFSL